MAAWTRPFIRIFLLVPNQEAAKNNGRIEVSVVESIVSTHNHRCNTIVYYVAKPDGKSL